MYFPSSMTFQYFFFDTYIGYFLQVLPIALIAGGIYAFCRARRAGHDSAGRIAAASLFVCYLTGLICLTLLIRLIGNFYYFLFYRSPSGSPQQWFVFTYDLVPDFFQYFRMENLGNMIMYLPFGILYPLFRRGSSWPRIAAAGLATSVVIELLQPVFGRSFDVNDIILNELGVVISATLFHGLRTLTRSRR